jgi:hypothetical protein
VPHWSSHQVAGQAFKGGSVAAGIQRRAYVNMESAVARVVSFSHPELIDGCADPPPSREVDLRLQMPAPDRPEDIEVDRLSSTGRADRNAVGQRDSAVRLYGQHMNQLWGGVTPLPPSHLKVLQDGEQFDLAGWKIRAVETPGHGFHHHAYSTKNILCGDIVAIRLPGVILSADRSSYRSWVWGADQVDLDRFF